MRPIFKLRQYFITRKLRKKLNNQNFTIISSNCVGGKIYHDLGQRFLSPTINLWFNAIDFLKFASNLHYYLNECNLIQKKDTIESYPVGTLGSGKNKITIHFTHYSTFFIAKQKWDARKQRINYNNLYIIFSDMDGGDKINIIDQFNKLPYKHKIMLTGKKYNKNNTFL